MKRNDDAYDPEVLEVVGRIIADWSRVEFGLDLVLAVVLQLPEGDRVTLGMLTVMSGRDRAALLKELYAESDRLTQDQKDAMRSLLQRADSRRNERNDVVHSLFLPIADEEQRTLLFRWARENQFREIGLPRLREIATKIRQLRADVLDFTRAPSIAR